MSGGTDPAALVARTLAGPPRAGSVRVVCVDGPSGAGKTTLAAALAAELSAYVGDTPAVVHGDEVYEGWGVVADEPDPVRAFTILGERLRAWLVLPWCEGRAGEHPVWDWRTGTWGRASTVPAAPVVVLEGVGLAGAALRPFASLLVWVDADPATRADRVADRDGADVAAHMADWRARETAWHVADRTAENADVHLRTD